jgi:hypothetical protein
MPNRCLICENRIAVDDMSVTNATIWTSGGNFGSGVYDPCNASVFLEAIICDACLLEKQALVEEVVVQKRTEVIDRRNPNLK